MVWDRPVVVLAVLLPAIVVPHLLDLGYWRLDLETLAIGLGACLVGLSLSIVEYKIPRIANLVIAIASYWLFDVYFDDRGYVAACVLLGVVIVLKSRHRNDACRVILAFHVSGCQNLLQPTSRYWK
jgi:hypothetical protein